MTLLEKTKESISFIEEKLGYRPTPKIALVLGSGLGVYADDLQDIKEIDFQDIPHFSKASVEGHKGKLIFGKIHGKEVALLQGRYHFYEGKGIDVVTYPIRVLYKLGIEVLFTTNATGGLNPDFNAGDFMIITDHINYMGVNPLIGANEDDFGPRFPDMTNIYTKELVDLAKSVAKEIDLDIKTGVLVGYSGPNYETPAEIKFFRMIGGDNVGMSTIPETIVASHCGLKVLSISSITNMAAGIHKSKLSHSEVMEISKEMIPTFKKLVDGIIAKL
ncbi:MAG: purine-nucleoside phosphorylase [Lachnospirales bacterium]